MMLDTIIRGETDGLVDLARRVQATGYRFVAPTPATHARVNARSGAAWARDLHDVFGWSRPFMPGTIPQDIVDAMRNANVLAPHEDGWRSLVRLSDLDGMTFLHSAYPTTAADAVFFGPDTYRFARATSYWLDRSHRQIHRAVDIGCGAGPGAALIARACPAADVYAADINDAALAITRANAALNGVAITAVNSNLLAAIPGRFDLIVANPPYLVDPAERAYRHGGGPLGAGLSLMILDAALDRLAPGGTLLLYTGAAIVRGNDPFHDAAAARLAKIDMAWRYEEIDPDVFGEELESGVYAATDRIAAVLLTVEHRNDQNARR